MITVTTEAKEMLSGVLQDAKQRQGIEDEEVGIRLRLLTPAGDSTSGQVRIDMVLDAPDNDDQVVEHGDDNVLIIDPTLGGILEGATIDVIESDEGRKLSIKQ